MNAPSTNRLAAALRGLFRRQLGEVVAALRKNPRKAPSLASWNQVMADALLPIVLATMQRSAETTNRRLARKVGKKSLSLCRGVIRKDRGTAPRDDLPFAIRWDVFDSRIFNAAQRLTLDFCASTNATATEQLQTALDNLRESLAVGLEQGEAQKTLTQRVQAIFTDPARAHAIAATESSRAVNAGMMETAQEAGATKKRWIASSDACKLCLSLAAKGVIPIGEDFHVEGRGTYSRVPHPPAHVWCMCSWEEIMD